MGGLEMSKMSKLLANLLANINRRMGGLESLDKIQGKARHINRRMGGLEN